MWGERDSRLHPEAEGRTWASQSCSLWPCLDRAGGGPRCLEPPIFQARARRHQPPPETVRMRPSPPLTPARAPVASLTRLSSEHLDGLCSLGSPTRSGMIVEHTHTHTHPAAASLVASCGIGHVPLSSRPAPATYQETVITTQGSCGDGRWMAPPEVVRGATCMARK